MWKKFDETRDFKISSGVLVIRPTDKSNVIPLFCSVCEFPMKTSDDFLSYKDYSCCHKCKIHLVSRDIEKWKNGWRPETQELKKYIDFRNETFKPTIRFS